MSFYSIEKTKNNIYQLEIARLFITFLSLLMFTCYGSSIDNSIQFNSIQIYMFLPFLKIYMCML